MAASGAGAQRKFMDEGGKMRKVSSKLFAEPASILRHLQRPAEEGGMGSSGDGSAGDAGGVMLAEMAGVPGVPLGQRTPEGQQLAVALLQLLGEGFRLLCVYRWGVHSRRGPFLRQNPWLRPPALEQVPLTSLPSAGAKRRSRRSRGCPPTTTRRGGC